MRTKSLLVAFVLGVIAALLSPTVAGAIPLAAPKPSTAAQPDRDTDAGERAAHQPTYNIRRLWLRFPAIVNGKDVCQWRNIKLASAWYDWYHVTDPDHGDFRRIYLAAGWYHWKDCIGGLTNPHGHNQYYLDTYLRQSSTGGYVYLQRGRVISPDSSGPIVYVQRTFGSALRMV